MLSILSKLFGVRTVEAGTLGVLNLSGSDAAAWIAEDKAALAPLFRELSESTQQPPSCNLLLLYCTLETDGSIVRHPLGLREIIRDSGAAVVVVRSTRFSLSRLASITLRKSSHVPKSCPPSQPTQANAGIGKLATVSRIVLPLLVALGFFEDEYWDQGEDRF